MTYFHYKKNRQSLDNYYLQRIPSENIRYVAQLILNGSKVVETFANNDEEVFFSDIATALEQHELTYVQEVNIKPMDINEIERFRSDKF